MASHKKILVIDDDIELCKMLVSYLSQFNLSVTYCTNPEDLQLTILNENDLVILDVMLPGQSGFSVCRDIRKSSRVPIIFVSARGAVNDRIVGLEIGADDYLQKPFEPRELVARIEAIFRRAETVQQNSLKLVADQICLDIGTRTVQIDAKEISLTTLEFDLLALFMRSSGKVLSRDFIRKNLNKSSWDGLDRSIDIAVSRIRQRIGDEPKQPKYLKTVWGEGYLFAKEVKNVR